MADANRQIVLDRMPQGDKLGPQHFRLTDGARPAPGDGEVLLRTRYISLDAANRAWMQGATYRSALESGQVMAGGALAEVVESNAGHLNPGDVVFADTGWQDYAVLPGKRLSRLPALEPMTHLMSVYGIAGLTAYFGLLECGKPKAGETVVVSAAAARWVRSSARSPRSRAAGWSAWPAARTRAAGWWTNSASTRRSTTRPATCAAR